MTRSIELGRAVLCSPTLNLELWLTTLITLSLTPDENNIQQLKPAGVLDHLASGDVWVGRDHGMHMKLTITLSEEPLDQKHLQDLTDAILRAPVWEQLMLTLTLPVDAVTPPGTVHLNISHANGAGVQEEQKRHRLFTDIPAADVRPPEGVPSVALRSVCLKMEILETSPRRKPTAKRSNTSPGEHKSMKVEDQNSDCLLYDMASVRDASQGGGTDRVSSPTSPARSRKRKRPATDSPLTIQPVPIDSAAVSKRSRRRPATDSFVQRRPPPDLGAGSSNRVEIDNIVDGALRLSICGGIGKSANGLKVKASTFRLGLTDVSPALWRNGYLSALSQRAHLLPTMARSFSRAACTGATSISLKDKMISLSAMSHEDSPVGSPGSDTARTSASIASRLWVHLQKNVHSKATSPLQACVSSGTHLTPADSDEMLAEVDQQSRYQHGPPMGDSNARSDNSYDILTPVPKISAPSASFDDQTLVDPNHVAATGEIEDDLLLNAMPHDLGRLGEKQFDTLYSSKDYPMWTSSASSQEPPLGESQRSLGTAQTEVSNGRPMLAGPDHPHVESLFEERGGSDVESTEDLLLAF